MEEYKQLEKLFDAKLGGMHTRFDSIDKEIRIIQKKQDYTNGTVRTNKEWIDSNRDNITDIVLRDKRFINKLFDLAWKVIIGVVAIVLGINWLN